jgi:hypothetical protein
MKQTFPFLLRDHKGAVSATFEANHAPSSWGYAILGLPWPSQLAEGMPVLEVTVRYEREGYESVMGWIQVVRIHVAESSEMRTHETEKAPTGDHTWVDGPPNLRGLGFPFVSFGPRPTLFDAPASTESRVRFVADSFLTASPDGLITPTSQPCLGLRWGYSTLAGKTELIIPEEIGPAEWQEALPTLEAQFPSWTFEKEWAP